MKNVKSTKYALLSGIAAIVLCVAMLIGTTFAWFTDSASTAVNKIQAGTFDVALEMKVGDTWVNAEGTTLGWVAADGRAQDNLFWEPGCTYNLNQFRIVNNGNLALKYKVAISGFVGDSPLFEVIDFTVSGVSGVTTVNALNGFEGELAAASATDAITISGHMRDSAGNEYQGLSINGIVITVVAKQAAGYEYDSNNNTYDENAEYPVMVSDVAGFENALTQGNSNIVLTNDVTVTNGVQMSVTNDTAINFNGNTLKGAVESGSISSSDGPTNLVLSDPNNSGEYSIDGELVQHTGGGYTQLSAITVWKPTVTIESGKYTHDNAVILCQLQTQDTDAVGVVINGGTFDGKGAASVIANIFGNVIVNNGEFNAHYDGDSSGECVYVSSGSIVPSITTINGGTFNADKRIFYVRVDTSYTQKIVVNGGTFNVAEGGSLIQVSSGNASDYLTITGGTFNVDPSAYVDTANYDVTQSGSTWSVTAK